MFILRNKTAGPLLVQDSYISQPFGASESIDLETIWTFEQLHKSTYYPDGAIGFALQSGQLELLAPNDGYRDTPWRFSSPRVEYVTLDNAQIINKKIVLKETPNKDLVALDVLGGLAQFPNIDYVVSGRELTWDSLGLDGLLETGDTLRIIYGS